MNTTGIRGAIFGAAFVGGLFQAHWAWAIVVIALLYWTYKVDDRRAKSLTQ